MRLIGAVLACLLMLAACGGDDDGGSTTAPEGTDPESTLADDQLDPEALAQLMVAEYETMIGEMVALLEQDLPPADLAPEIAALKDEYIDIFVSMGHQREAFDADEVAAFNQKATVALFSLEFNHQEMVNELLSELNAAGENDLAREINSLNILTQYAQFELLWDQEPDEAERLELPSPAHPR